MKNAERLINEAIQAHKAGQLDAAFAQYNRALKLVPNHPKLLYFFGILESQRDNDEHAEQLLEKCSKIIHGDADIEYNLGTVCQKLGKHKKAVKRFNNAISANPRQWLAYLNLGASYIQLAEYDNALPVLETAITLSPGNEDILFNLAKTHFHLAHWSTALDYAQKIEPSSRLYVDAIVLAADALTRNNEEQAALAVLETSLHNINNKSVIFNKIGNIHFAQSHFDEARSNYEKAAESDPSDHNSYTSLGKLFFTTGDHSRALQWLHTGTEQCPDNALIKNNLGLIQLTNGQLADGWRHYLYRSIERAYSKQPPFSQLDFDLSGQTIYLVPDQGIGDQLFFLRFIPLLLDRHAQVKICVNEKLVPVLKNSAVEKYIAGLRKIPLEGEIYELGDLPYLLSCGDNDFLTPLPLVANPECSLIEQNGLPNVGITWRGGADDGKTLFKEIELTAFLDALKCIDANWFILQRNPKPEELDVARTHLGSHVHDVSELNEDLAGMLALLNQLDDHIGVSNTNVHLRSCLGNGGKVLIPNPPDWRWLAHGEYSPWVPGYKVYRQQFSGDWSDALNHLEDDLKKEFN